MSDSYNPLAQQPPSLSERSRLNSNDSDGSDISTILENINSFSSGNKYTPVNDSNDDNEDAEKDIIEDGYTFKKNTRKRLIIGGIVTIIVLGSLLLFHSVTRTSHASSTNKASSPNYKTTDTDGKKLFDMDSWRKGSLSPSFKVLNWVTPEPKTNKAQLLEESTHGYRLVNWPDRDNFTVLMTAEEKIFEYGGKSYFVGHVDISTDHTKLILKTNIKKNYRHSTFSNFFVYDLKEKTYTPISSDAEDLVAIAHWSPDSKHIAYVLDNNLYIKNIETGKTNKVTKDGGKDIFYGRPDWVYEEEVFSADSALWWSPDGKYVAFLRSNESQVEEFPIPYFMGNKHAHGHAAKYPKMSYIKYPKPGTPNPTVALMLLDVAHNEVFEAKVDEEDKEKLITEVIWAGNSELVSRITNRESDALKISVFDASTRNGIVSRVTDVSEDGGWFEISHNMKFIPKNLEQGREHDGYIDVIVKDGYNHLSYFSPVNSTEPKAVLTSGEWEVVEAAIMFNPNTNRVYFTATKKSSVERHLYSVKLDGTDLKAITNEKEDGWYSVSYSSNNRYAMVDYTGPDIPWQKVVDLESEKVWEEAVVVTENNELRKKVKDYNLPTATVSQIVVAKDDNGKDIVANAIEYLPPHFDETKQYPVLFYVYGGPVSQQVTKKFSYGFSQVVSSVHDAIVVTVDGRGTGFMGRDFRSCVRQKLGYFESRDQITAAKLWASKPYVDPSRIAIWGWSYGGFTTLKTLETDGGETFNYGMAVAPVTDWRFYDSIYTERYMKTPEHNQAGYSESAITNVTSIAQNTRFLLMHGTGDDNVHIQNSMILLDLFDLESVENYDVHVFPDSDHSIMFHNANKMVYNRLLRWIGQAFAGDFLPEKN